MKNKMIALLLAVVMVLGLFAGCGSNETPSTTGGGNAATDEPVNPADGTEEPVKLTFMLNAEVIEGSIGDQWISQIEEHCNVEIEWISPAASAYEDTLQLTLLDDERPDAMIIPTGWMSSTTFKDACENGIFMDISGMVTDYENIMAHTAEASWNALDIFKDGSIWGVPRSTVMRADGFGLNEQWLEAIGFDYTPGEFLTLDEFYDILYAFTYDDPDGNGVDDTYGLCAYSTDDGTLISFLDRIFHLGTGTEVYDINGEPVLLKYSQEHDNYKQYLEFVNKCWEAGVIDPDAFSLDQPTAFERLYSTVGCYGQYPANLNKKITEAKPYTYVYVPGVVVDENDTYGYGECATGVYWYWSISSDCQNPEKVLEVFDYMLSDEQWGNLSARNLEGVGFTITEDGEYDFSLTEALTEQGLGNIEPINLVMRRSEGAEFFVDKSLPKETRDIIAMEMQMCFDLYVAPLDDGYVPSISTDPIFVEYKAYMIQEIAKIITGVEPVEHWDEVLAGWYEAGGTEYVAEVMEYINSK